MLTGLSGPQWTDRLTGWLLPQWTDMLTGWSGPQWTDMLIGGPAGRVPSRCAETTQCIVLYYCRCNCNGMDSSQITKVLLTTTDAAEGRKTAAWPGTARTASTSGRGLSRGRIGSDRDLFVRTEESADRPTVAESATVSSQPLWPTLADCRRLWPIVAEFGHRRPQGVTFDPQK